VALAEGNHALVQTLASSALADHAHALRASGAALDPQGSRRVGAKSKKEPPNVAAASLVTDQSAADAAARKASLVALEFRALLARGRALLALGSLHGAKDDILRASSLSPSDPLAVAALRDVRAALSQFSALHRSRFSFKFW